MELTPKEVKKLLQKEDPIILEIGAHRGYETKLFLNKFKNIKLFCFEIDPRCIEGFKANINDNRCILIETAASNKDGKTILHMSSGKFPGRLRKIYKILKLLKLTDLIFKNNEDWDYSSSIKTSISNAKTNPWLVFNKEIEVKTTKLDTWLKENLIEHIDFIWSDIQGGERDLIEGAIHALKITKYLYTEYGETDTYPEAMTREETIELLNKHNFELIEQYSSKAKTGNLLFRNRSILLNNT